ncbi:amino acid ABC transporter substrate-binding protein [Slackia equolifaciens]|uniref:Amino acid ABC transporter substrate-binding protein n=1 Tax=Slackia equolifaciens TaxID=498718 RepID=A0A3N0AZB5_9ACTN|nr:basic amino acid ABC transporter substrate-binding protein [Slackia equolifaciens]RNL40235.1 amino acid ABC transporter substrate-binding protein [Slackia equolifaciens]
MKAKTYASHLSKFLLCLIAALSLCAVVALAGCSSNSDTSTDTSANTEAAESTDTNTAATDDGSYTLVEDGKLTVVASIDFPPFENLVDGQPEGFEVDLMTAIAEQMGLEINYLPTMKFDALVPAIAAGGTADVSAAGITITPDREAEVDFSDPIMDSNQCIVVKKGSDITGSADLSGKTIGGQSGTTGIDWAKENAPDAEIKTFDEYTAVLAALQSGQVEAVVMDKPVADYYILNAYQDCEVVEAIPTGEQYGIAVSKDNPNLTAAINEALQALKDNGTYEEIQMKWFGTTD